MRTFKRGDRVAVMSADEDDVKQGIVYGMQGTIDDECSECPYVVFDATGIKWAMRAWQLAPVIQLPTIVPPDSATRKGMPLFSGVLMYFPDALLAVAEHSKRGSDKHQPGQPMRWAKEKSPDQADCIARHLVDIGPNWDAIDPETQSLHATALAWRALALLQTVLERSKK